MQSAAAEISPSTIETDTSPVPPPRTAVILAAGAGARMSGRYQRPKPLLSLLGLRLIERVVLSLADNGVTRFRVVLGANREVMAEALGRSRRLRGLAIELVDCPDHAAGNGHSLAAGVAGLDEPFYLSMADHVFDPAVVGRLRAAAADDPHSVHLATDADIDGVFDLDDATKVATAGSGAIQQLGKQLPEYDRVDVGVFYCPAWLAREAQATIRDGAHSVSDVMARAIDRDAMRSCPIEPLFWQDIDTPEMLAEARRRLLDSTRKETDGPVARHFNRHVSLATTRWLAPLGISPNLVTTAAFAMGMAGALFTTFGTWPWMIAAAFLVQAASIWDGCDGELARVTLRRSKFGAWYDTLTDNIRMIALVIGCAVGLYVRHDHVGYLIGGGALVGVALYLYFTMVSYLRRHQAHGSHLVLLEHVQQNAAAFERIPIVGQAWKLAPAARQDIVLLLAAIALAINLPHLVVVGAGLCLGFAAIIVTIVLRKTEPAAVQRGDSCWAPYVATLVGAGILVALVSQYDLIELTAAWSHMGWGVLLIPAIALVWFAANTYGLRSLSRGRAGWGALFSARMMGEAYNALTPLATEGGEPVKVRQLARHVPVPEAYSVLIVGRALQIVSGLLFSAVCLAVGVVVHTWPGLIAASAIAYIAVALGLSYVVGRYAITLEPQRYSRWLLARMGACGDQRVQPVGAGPVMRALAWHLLGRAVLVAEIAWLLHLIGVPLDPLTVIGITGIVSVGAMFSIIIPQSLGIAEAAAILAFILFGYAGVWGLAFALVRRGRVLLLSFIGVAWHHVVVALERRAELPAAQVEPKPQP